MEISQSIVEGAGLGVKALAKISKNTIVLSYAGTIKLHYEVMADNNSIFSFGILTTNNECAIMVDPIGYGNAGHYVNTAYGQYNNCRAEIGMFIPRDSQP